MLRLTVCFSTILAHFLNTRLCISIEHLKAPLSIALKISTCAAFFNTLRRIQYVQSPRIISLQAFLLILRRGSKVNIQNIRTFVYWSASPTSDRNHDDSHRREGATTIYSRRRCRRSTSNASRKVIRRRGKNQLTESKISFNLSECTGMNIDIDNLQENCD